MPEAQEASPFFSVEHWMEVLRDRGPSVLLALLALFVTFRVARIASNLTVRASERAKVDRTLALFFGKLVRWLVVVLGLLVVLGMFGIETASFAVVLGAAGFAIGMALQGTLGNFASGVMLLVFRPFRVGDVVNVGGITGKVLEIGLFSTQLDTPDGRRIIVPNGSVYGSTIENVTHNPKRRADVAVGVDYAADLDRTREVLEKAAASVPQRDPELGHQVVCTGLGASSVDWVVRVWCRTEDYWPCKEATTVAIKKELDAAGIGIPFPQLDVHLDQAVS